jgi:hypothetical protein
MDSVDEPYARSVSFAGALRRLEVAASRAAVSAGTLGDDWE